MENDKIADDVAKSVGFDSAEYIGKDKNLSIYNGVALSGKEVRMTGLPLWISVDDSGSTDYGFGFKYMYLIKER